MTGHHLISSQFSRFPSLAEMCKILPPTLEAVAAAADHLRSGGLVAIPTETVYGVAGDTFNPAALEAILTLKGRPRNNPMIAHVGDVDRACALTPRWPVGAAALAERFWPGPLTIIVDRGSDVPLGATGGRETIAIRWPRHTVAQQILDAFGGPLSAPSANITGRTSTTRATDVARDFADRPGGDALTIIDGGPCAVGVESTVIDLSSQQTIPAILRPGVVTVEEIQEVIGDVTNIRQDVQGSAPGTSQRHYAPSIPLTVTTDPAACLSPPPGSVVIVPEGVEVDCDEVRVLPSDPAGFAQQLYAALHDAQGDTFDQIIVVAPLLETPAWAAIRDRLYRASSV
jgi:L-threonylcarbamoyladenylate synthase